MGVAPLKQVLFDNGKPLRVWKTEQFGYHFGYQKRNGRRVAPALAVGRFGEVSRLEPDGRPWKGLNHVKATDQGLPRSDFAGDSRE